jgi:hypothetical protein
MRYGNEPLLSIVTTIEDEDSVEETCWIDAFPSLWYTAALRRQRAM